MKDIVHIRKKAIELRRGGFSYADISIQLKVSKTSISNWVKNVRLTESEKVLLRKNQISKIHKGRQKSSISIRVKRVFKEKVSYENAEKDFQKIQKEALFMLGLGLYLAHGLKKTNYLHFSSSDVEIIKVMQTWMKKYLNLPANAAKYRLFVSESSKSENPEQFWLKSCGISENNLLKTVYSKVKTRKDREYKGSLTIIVSKIQVIRQVIAWQKLAMRYYS